jgi:CheY-like chemotaxis protein
MAQQTPRILILDDEEAVRRVLQNALERLGYELNVASSGPEALTLLSRNPYDLVICDIQMPGLSGIDFYRELERNLPSLADRVIFITGDMVHLELQHFLDTIKANVLRKPFDLEGLYTQVNTILGRDYPEG